MILFDRVKPNTTILTPNSRLSAILLKQHYQWQVTQGKTCWHSIDVLPFPSWIQRLWQQYSFAHLDISSLVLTASQEQLLWEEILNQSPEGEYLLQLSSTAELAKSAWATLKQWQVDLHNPSLTTTEDSQIFQQWALTFHNLCEQNNWIDSYSLANIIIQKISEEKIGLPKNMILLGFTEITPQQQNLIDVCQQLGIDISHNENINKKTISQRISLQDEESEIYSMARWAKSLLTTYPTTSIGCIVPRLDKVRERVIQIFSDVFSEKNSYTLNHTILPFNISAGKSLALYPVINTALKLLNLNTNNIPIETISSLLRSPFLGEAEKEMSQRSNFDNFLRKTNVSTVSFKSLLNADLKNHCPFLAKRIKAYIELITNEKQILTISEWTTHFIDILTSLGWPGERSLNSAEYQVVDAWLTLLKEYTAFDKVLDKQTGSRTLHYLTYLTTKKIFQPESPDTAPIQILGALEAAEIPFEYSWVMGIDDTTWPPIPKPNPFIPQRLQKTLLMPHATAERELIYCQQLTRQLKKGADNIIFSHALYIDDAELRPSPIISMLPEITINDIELSDFNTPAQQIFASQDIVVLHDEIAPAVSQIEIERLRGGSSIFKNQAACPFKAFAENRLHAKKIDPPTLGLRPQDRGNIVHKALELIWNALQCQETLLRMEEGELIELISTCVDTALTLNKSESIDNLRYRTIEANRLQKLFLQWLELEKLRPDFKVISQEETRNITVGNIPLTVRVDRVDELENSKKIIIDYKTAKYNSTKSWFGERPDEPQLPLYCIADSEKAIGILFAQINPEEIKWVGISETELGIDSVKTLIKTKDADAPTWKLQVQQWQLTLEKLAMDFLQGIAYVDPKEIVETCNHCHLHSLCRIHESITA